MPEESATGTAPPAELKQDVGEAAEKVGEANQTAAQAGEDALAATLGRIESTLNDIKQSIGLRGGATQVAEKGAAPVKQVEETAEAVVPEVVVKPRKAHWSSGLPKWL